MGLFFFLVLANRQRRRRGGDAVERRAARVLFVLGVVVGAKRTPVLVLHHESGVAIALGDGRSVRFAEETFVAEGGTVSPAKFAGPGGGSDEIGGGDCGVIGGVKVLAGGGDWLLVAPDQIDLGGDSCIGMLGAELAMIVKLAK